MTKVLDGVKVVEVAVYGYVPAAAAAMADWGADVIKIEHPEHGDPVRGLVASGVKPGDGGVTPLWETFNRGKRSAGIDISRPEGLELLLALIDRADVFLTNFLGPARQRLGIDDTHIRRRNPSIIYARGTGQGVVGPEKDNGGFDLISYWGRTGLASAAMPSDYDYPITLPAPAFGDVQAGLNLAGAVAAALFRRERSGDGATVDGSLLSSGLWAMQAGLAGSFATRSVELPKWDRQRPGNPLVNAYRTADGRFLQLCMLEADRFWPGLCTALGKPEWIEHPRLATAELRLSNVEECVELLDQLFAQRSLDKWTDALEGQEGQWSVIRPVGEVVGDQQVRDNGYIQMVEYENGATLPLVPAPAQYDGQATTLTRAPGHGEHTDEVLRELLMSEDEILELKIDGVVT